MRKGLITVTGLGLAAILASGMLAAQVYKVVDEHGNVTYTDQPPADGTPPMDLPELSVVESEDDATEVADPATLLNPSPADAAAVAADQEKTPRELRRMFADFRILTPTPQETFWGTANVVVVSWGASAAYEEGMQVSVVVNGDSQDVDPNGNLPLTLDRGEHQVYAVLRDNRGRRIVTTDTVTFHVKQASARINPG